MNTRIIIDRLSERDLPDVAAIVRHWVRRDGEVIEEEAAAAMATIGAGLNRASGSHYLVAREDRDVVLGVMGFGILNAKLVPYKTNPEGNAVGLLTAFPPPPPGEEDSAESCSPPCSPRPGPPARRR